MKIHPSLPGWRVHDLSLGWEGRRWLGKLLKLGEAEVVLLAVHGAGLVPDLALDLSDLGGVRGHHLLLAADLGLMVSLADLTLGRQEAGEM